MKSCIKHFVAFCTILFVPALVWGQTLNLNQFGIEEGLPQSSVNTMVFDKRGNIWVGTMAGASKYNGLSFESYTKRDGLAENRVLSSTIDKNGNIWFGHWAGGISVYSDKDQRFYEVPTAKHNIYRKITSVAEGANGNIYFGTNGLGILKYTIPQDSLHTGSLTKISEADGLPSDVVNDIKVSGKDMFLATGKGLVKFDGNKSFSTVKGLPEVAMNAIMFDINNVMWVGSADKGLFRSNSNGGYVNYTEKQGLSNNSINVIFEDNNGTVFVGTNGGGVSKYLKGLEENNYNGPWFQTISIEQGLSSTRVLSIIQDREKNIWIGTTLNLNQYFDEQFEIYGGQEGLESSLVWSVIQGKGGNYWLGTEGGLVKFELGENTNDSKFTKVAGIGNVSNTTALYEDVNGDIWYTNFKNGVSRYNPATRKVTNYTVADGLANNEVYAITGDKNGNIWIGTNKGGISVFSLSDSKFVKNYTKKDGLGSDQVYALFKDRKGNMWIGTLGGALTMYDGNKFYTYSRVDGFDSKFTVCITEDKNGNIWFGTYGEGIYKYDGKAFRNYTTANGLSSDSPFMLVVDNDNYLWVGTGLGVDRFDMEAETFKHYSKDDGFLGVEINPNAVCKDTDGDLWFGSIIGVVRYNASKAKVNVAEPITYISNPRVHYEEVEMPEDMVFSYSQNHLTFDFVGASLTNPKRVRYKYKLEGFNKEWSPVVKDNYVTYPNLPQGKYTFKVISRNNDGVWNKEPVTFSFTIKPPFYKTWWFYTLVTIVVVVIVFSYIKNRERVLRQRNQELEQKVNERTEQIQLQKAEIERKNENITDSIDYAKRIQEAVFVSKQEIKRMLPESFILFKPKDIVSGDFYWVTESKDKVFFAAVDCTGHGVPGAFMSIIGYNLLTTIVKDENIDDPAKILKKLDDLVYETLSQQDEGSTVKEVKDGMDLGICVLDRKTNKLKFAGAYNGLYHVSNGKLTEYKADKLPIGKSSIHAEGEFTTHEIEVKKGDMLYLFSDGYADQIGGPKRKKFYYPPFKKLLTDISTKSMKEQESTLDTTIVEWLGSRDQVDDIIVMGVKV